MSDSCQLKGILFKSPGSGPVKGGRLSQSFVPPNLKWAEMGGDFIYVMYRYTKGTV